MSWSKRIPCPGHTATRASVRVGIHRYNAGTWALVVSFRADSAARLGWAKGDALAVEVGAAEHAGRLRVRKAPDGVGFALHRRTRRETAPLEIKIAAWRGLPKAKRSLTAVEVAEPAPGVLELVLPAWGQPPEPAPEARAVALRRGTANGTRGVLE